MKLLLLPIITILILGFSTAYAHEYYPDKNFIPDNNFIPEKNHISEAPDVITYGIISSPGPKDETRIIQSIDRAFEIWEEHNPSLNFEKVDYFPDIIIDWSMKPSSDVGYFGIATYRPTSYQGAITIQLGDYNCESVFVEFGSNSLTNTIMHEVGHILGLLHHTDENHLLFSTDDFVMEDFDELGYNIPKKLEGAKFFVGEKLLRDRLVMIEQKINGIDKDNPQSYEDAHLLDEYEIVQEKLECFHDNISLLTSNYRLPELPSVPSMVTGLSTISSDGTVILSWNSQTSSTAGIVTYTVEYSDDNGDTWKSYNDFTTIAEITVTGLTNDTLYHFRVSASNSLGFSDPSDIVTATPQAN